MDPLQLQPLWLTPQHAREGRYVLGPLLGRGGMGEVVEAWDVVLCRTVALKLLRKIEPTAMVQFMTEAQLQGRIIHPNICRIYDVESAESTLKIAMQLVRGPNLSQAARAMALPEAVAIIAQVAEAVNVAHLMKLIHRDIKPSNILLDEGPDGRLTPCLCDFGLAISLAEPALNITQGMAGTPAYMAPEQFRGERGKIGPATDIYALGGSLHFVLMGHPPSHQPTSSNRDMKPGMSRDLQMIIHKCLEPEPGDRYATASALALDLRRFLNGDPVLAQPRGLLARAFRRARKHSRTLSLGAGSVMVLAAAFTVLMGRQVREEKGAQEAIRSYGNAEAEWERDLGFQHALPGHDMRLLDSQGRERGARIMADLATLGPAFQGPGHAAIGRIDLLLGAYEPAAQELETAWRQGVRGARAGQDAALARVLATWAGEGSMIKAPPAAGLAGAWLPASGSAPLAEALAAFQGRDFRRAAAAAASYHRLHPWHGPSALLATASLGALAGEMLEAGAAAEAEARFQEALLQLEGDLGPGGGGASDPVVLHAYFLTARRLGELQLAGGTLSEGIVKSLQERCDRACLLDPESAELLEDWLELRVLAARRCGELGLDRFPELDPAMVFLGTRVREPLSPGLQAARMALHWQLAEQQLALGQDARFALTEALRDSDRPPLSGNPVLARVLNCEARLESAQGADPRPTLARALGVLEPLLKGGPCWPLNATAAEAWMLRAEWEQRHGQDPRTSLQLASGQIDRGLRAFPGDPRVNALQGLLWVAQMRADPARRPVFLPQARARLRQSRGWLAQHLRQSIEELR